MKFSILAIATLAAGVIAAPAPEAEAGQLAERTSGKNKCDKYASEWERCMKKDELCQHEYEQCVADIDHLKHVYDTCYAKYYGHYKRTSDKCSKEGKLVKKQELKCKLIKIKADKQSKECQDDHKYVQKWCNY